MNSHDLRPDTAFTYEMTDDETVSEAVVNAVAAASGYRRVRSFDADDAEPVLDPLYSAIDPDALDTLFERTDKRPGPADWQLSFSFHGYQVRVTSDGFVDIAASDW